MFRNYSMPWGSRNELKKHGPFSCQAYNLQGYVRKPVKVKKKKKVKTDW